MFMISTMYLEFFRDMGETAVCNPIPILLFHFNNRVLILFRSAVYPTKDYIFWAPLQLSMPM